MDTSDEIQLSGAYTDHRANISDLHLTLQDGLKAIRINKLTPLQSVLISQFISNRDVTCIAQPDDDCIIGVAIGILNDILNKQCIRPSPKAIFLAATTEVAWYIYKVLTGLLPRYGLVPHPMIEGSELPESRNASWLFPVIVATPNTIVDAVRREEIRLKPVDYIAFIRADEMFHDATIRDQCKSFCREVGTKHGIRVLTSYHEIPQNLIDLCLRDARPIQVASFPMQKQITLNFLARPPDERPWETVLRYIRRILPKDEQILVVTETVDGAKGFSRELRRPLGRGGSLKGVTHRHKTKEEQDEAMSFFTIGHSSVLVAPEVPDLKFHKASTVLFLPPPINLEVIMKGVSQLKPANGQLVVFFHAKALNERKKSLALSRHYIQTVENAKVIWTDNGTAIWDSSTVPQHPSCDVDAAPSSRLLVIGVPRAWNNWEVLSAMSKHAPLDMDRKMISVGEWEHFGYISFRDVSAATGCLKEWDANILGNNIIRMCYASAPVKDESQNVEDGGRKKRVKVEVIE